MLFKRDLKTDRIIKNTVCASNIGISEALKKKIAKINIKYNIIKNGNIIKRPELSSISDIKKMNNKFITKNDSTMI